MVLRYKGENMIRFDSFDKIDYSLIKKKLEQAQQVRQNKKQHITVLITG